MRRAFIRRHGAGALHRKRAFYSIDHAAELDDGAIADQLHDATVVVGNCGVEDGFPVPFESGQRARLVSCHQARITHYVCGKDCRQSTVDALFAHEQFVSGVSGVVSGAVLTVHSASTSRNMLPN